MRRGHVSVELSPEDGGTDLVLIDELPRGVVTTVPRGAGGNGIVLEGVSADGSPRRWSFNGIRPDSSEQAL